MNRRAAHDEVVAGIAEAQGALSMIAGVDEIAADALPRFTTCPICGGGVAFAPLAALDIPRVQFTPDTSWGQVCEEWVAYALEYCESAREASHPMCERDRVFVTHFAQPIGLMLECHSCGKGFDPR